MSLKKELIKKSLRTELHKVVIVENKLLKEDGKALCHKCREVIPLKNTGNYCKACRDKIVEENRDKILASKKKWRDRNKEKQQAYRDSRKEHRRNYDRLRYEKRKRND